jgi:uncharacterized protein YqeY
MRVSLRHFGALSERLSAEAVAAMRAKDPLRLSVIRSVKSRITYKLKEPNAPADLDDAQVAALIQSTLADLDKTIAEVSQVKSDRSAELVEAARKEKTILLEFLPKQASEADVVKAIGEVIVANGATHGVKDMKTVLPLVAKQFGSGVFDAKLLGKLVKSELEKAEKKD